MEIMLGGRPYMISKLEGAAATHWVGELIELQGKLFNLGELTELSLPDAVNLMQKIYPRFLEGLPELLSAYAPGLPWERAQPGELLTAFQTVLSAAFPGLERGAEKEAVH